jgi:hypothetical protein
MSGISTIQPLECGLVPERRDHGWWCKHLIPPTTLLSEIAELVYRSFRCFTGSP